MKSLLLVTLDYPPHLGGVASYYYGLAKALGAKEISVLTTRQGASFYIDTESDITVYRKPLLSSWGPVKWRSSFWYIWRTLKKSPAKFVAVGHLLPIGTVVYILSLFTRQKYIVFCHGMDVLQSRKTWRKRFLSRRIFLRASLVVVNSESTLKIVRNTYNVPSIKTVIIPPCPEPIAETTMLPFNESRMILSVARLVRRKGIDTVIKSLPHILEKFPDAHYVIIGDGEDREYLTRLAQKTTFIDRELNAERNLVDAGKISFLGAVELSKLHEYYQSCEVFVLPVREVEDDIEGFGVVFLEANLFNKPVVAGASGGAVEAVIDQETGILVDPKSSWEVAQATVSLLRSKELRERLGRQGRLRVLQRFQWIHQAERLLEVLNDIFA